MFTRFFLWIGIVAPIAALSYLPSRTLANEIIPPEEEIILECQEFDTGFYTVLPQGEEWVQLLAYQSVDTPEETCHEATERLNNIISKRGSRQLSDLLLRTGTSRSEDVICAVFNTSSGCSRFNVVLNVSEEEVPADFLEKLLAIDAEVFSLGNRDQHTRRRTYAQFGQGIQRRLRN